MSKPITPAELPTSFGAFKPVDHVMVGVPSVERISALRLALLGAGWTADELLDFAPSDSVEEMQALIDNASGLAGFGYEITLMRRYVDLAREGCGWLLVYVADADQAARVAEFAKGSGARLAVYYRTLSVEELI